MRESSVLLNFDSLSEYMNDSNKIVVWIATISIVIFIPIILLWDTSVINTAGVQQTSEKQKRRGSGIFLTNNIEEKEEMEHFYCKDRMYAVVSEVKEKGKHMMWAEWISPKGERYWSQSNFSVADSSLDAWVWLKLNPGFGGSLFSKIDPSAGMEKLLGRWRVKIFLDERLVQEKRFIVWC